MTHLNENMTQLYYTKFMNAASTLYILALSHTCMLKSVKSCNVQLDNGACTVIVHGSVCYIVNMSSVIDLF